jgi:hypothetical protein
VLVARAFLFVILSEVEGSLAIVWSAKIRDSSTALGTTKLRVEFSAVLALYGQDQPFRDASLEPHEEGSQGAAPSKPPI